MPPLRIFKHIKALLSIDLITYCILLSNFRRVPPLSVPLPIHPSTTLLPPQIHIGARYIINDFFYLFAFYFTSQYFLSISVMFFRSFHQLKQCRLTPADDRQQNTLFYSSRKVLCTTNQDTLFYWLCAQVLLFRLFSAVRFLCSLPMFMTLIRISTDVSHFPRLLMLGILISS